MHVSLSYFCPRFFFLPVPRGNLKYKNSRYRYWDLKEQEWCGTRDRIAAKFESTSNEKTSRWLKTFYIPLCPLTFRAAPRPNSLDTRVSRERAGLPCSRARSTSKEFSSRLGVPPFDRGGPSSLLFSYTRVSAASRLYLTSVRRDSRSRQVVLFQLYRDDFRFASRLPTCARSLSDSQTFRKITRTTV